MSELARVSPEVREEHLAKYRGREAVTRQAVPPLGCLWNEVIHLSPINPQLILNLWRELGLDFPKKTLEVIRIPARALVESKTVIFLPHGKTDRRDFFSFRHETFRELTSVRKAQIADWRDQQKNGFPLFWYSSTEHVLTQGEIDISSCETFDVS